MVKKSLTSITPLSATLPKAYKTNLIYSANQKKFNYPPMPPHLASSNTTTMPYNFKDLILPDHITKLANAIGIDPFEIQFLISQIEKIGEDEILVPRLKSLFSEMKLIYGDELQVHNTRIKERKHEYEKWQKVQQNAASSTTTVTRNFKALKAQEKVNDLYHRYLKGVHVWNKRQLKKDKELRFILSTSTLHFVTKGVFPFAKVYVEGLIPELWNNPTLVDEIYNLL
jgi:hypothetical protein